MRTGLSRLRNATRLALLILAIGTGSTLAQELPATGLLVALEQARDALNEGEHELGESLLRSALLEGWILLGTLDAAAGESEQAAASFRRAESVSSEVRRPRLALAMLAMQAGAPDEAAVTLRKLVAANSQDFEARRLLAQALTADGQVDLAVQELEELRILAPEQLENSYLLATIHLKRGDLDDAKVLLQELAVARPIPQTHVLIGRTYRDFSFFPEAREALRLALGMDPERRRANFYLGTIALLDASQAGLGEAQGFFEQELRLTPDDAIANLYLGMVLVEQRRHEEALPHLELAAGNASTRAGALQFSGRSYLALDRPAEAIEVLRQALDAVTARPVTTPEGEILDRQEGQISTLNYQLALAYRGVGDEAAAAPHFEAARASSARITQSSRESLRRYLDEQVDEWRPALMSSAFEIPQLDGLDQAARDAVRTAIEQGMARAYLDLGILLTRASRFLDGATMFESAIALSSELEPAYHSLGVALFNAGDFERAVTPLDRASTVNPGNADLRRMLALALLNTEAYQRAAELLADDPTRTANPRLQYAYGLALVRSGHAEAADVIFTELLEQNADWPQLNVVLGQAHAQLEDYESAIVQLHRALSLDPGVAEAHATLGDLYLRLGRLEDAERELRAELENHTEDFRARATLAVVLDLLNRPQEALAEILAVLEVRPDFANARYLAGKVLVAEGHFEEGLAHLLQAARIAPDDANVHYQLGIAYQRTGRTAEATEAFETSRQLKNETRPGGES